MGQIVPLQAVPNQTLAVPLNGQSCQLNVYQKSTGMFIDVFRNGSPIIVGVICEDRNRIVRDLYLGFSGDFAFYDTQGTAAPTYTGLGDRYQLLYLEPSDLPDGVG